MYYTDNFTPHVHIEKKFPLSREAILSKNCVPLKKQSNFKLKRLKGKKKSAFNLAFFLILLVQIKIHGMYKMLFGLINNYKLWGNHLYFYIWRVNHIKWNWLKKNIFLHCSLHFHYFVSVWIFIVYHFVWLLLVVVEITYEYNEMSIISWK